MHAPFSPKEMIQILALEADDNPLSSLPEDAETIPFSVFMAWSHFWLGKIIKALERTPLEVSLEDLAEILDSDDSPIRMLPEYELSKDPAYRIPQDATVPRVIWAELLNWYPDAIVTYVENKRQGENT